MSLVITTPLKPGRRQRLSLRRIVGVVGRPRAKAQDSTGVCCVAPSLLTLPLACQAHVFPKAPLWFTLKIWFKGLGFLVQGLACREGSYIYIYIYIYIYNIIYIYIHT